VTSDDTPDGDAREFDGTSGLEPRSRTSDRRANGESGPRPSTDGESADDSATPTGDGPAGGAEGDAGGESAAKMRRALKEVRREGRKVAVIYAVVDAALVVLLSNLALRLYRPSVLPETVALPASVVGAGGVVPAGVHGASIVGLALGLVVGVAEFALRTRRPLVEQFEAANPPVREALRTARDALDDGANTEMATRLYEDVVGRLRETSSAELVGTRRVVLTTVLVVALSIASIQVAVVDLDLTDALGGSNTDDGGAQRDPAERDPAQDDLQDGDQILGDAEDVSAGDESLNATIEGAGEGSGGGSGSTAPPSSYDSGGFSGGTVESQRAGFAEQEQIEDAELIREYNLRIRDDGDDDDNDN
jgi:hypothetical protein